MRIWRIYGWRSPENKWYVGCTSNCLKKRPGHNGIKYIKKCPIFGEAIQKYGWDSMEENILGLYLTKEEAEEAEKRFIKEKDSLYPNGYNLQDGGHSNFKHHITTIQTMDHAGEKNGMYGHHQTEEVKKQHSERMKGRRFFTNGEIEVRRYECPEGFRPGRLPVSLETKKRMSEARKEYYKNLK